MLIGLFNIAVRLWCWLELIVLTLIMYALSFIPRSIFGPIYEKLFLFWTRVFVLAMGVELKLHQHYAGKLPEQYIVIANHPSAFEDIGMTSLFRAYPVAKIGVRDWFLVGRISDAAGTIFLKRDDKSSRKAAGAEIVEALTDGHNIAIYPEGGCKGRRINQFLYGIFGISIETGVPIVPVFLHYEAQEDFEWQGQTLPQKMLDILFASNRTANYHIYDAFDPAEFDDRESYCAHVHQQYLQWQDKHLL